MENCHTPVVAILYDFDKTLSPDDMQAQGYIQSVGFDVAEFWKETNVLATQNKMDDNLAYMYKMVTEAKHQFPLTREALQAYGSKVQLFQGVETWFSRMNSFGEAHGVKVEHYIVSSGLREMIEGTAVKEEFTEIYASSFYYNEEGLAVWPAQAINYTNKTQFLFRISKGCTDINSKSVNDKTNTYRVPFTNMIYIGDSDTDIPCMKLLKDNHGHSIGVYNPQTGKKEKVERLKKEGRIEAFAPADYREGSPLDTLVKEIVLHIANKA